MFLCVKLIIPNGFIIVISEIDTYTSKLIKAWQNRNNVFFIERKYK
jgi:hypothetical protein